MQQDFSSDISGNNTNSGVKKQKNSGGAKPRAPRKKTGSPAEGGAAKTTDKKSAQSRPTGGAKSVDKKAAAEPVSKKPAANRPRQTASSKQPTGEKSPSRSKKNKSTLPVKITFIGGLNEIGKNVTMYECGDDAILVDCGMAFPDDTMLGIDLVLPDITYVEQNREKIRGVVLTHGHEDHIGGIPYLLRSINCPVYGTKLTLGLLEGKLREHNMLETSNLNVAAPGDTIELGCIKVELINVNHSIPDAVALAIHTPGGTIVQTGDFKIDMTPIHGDIIDLGRFAQLGEKGVLCLLSDSTNAERQGYTASERTVGSSFNTLFQSASATGKRIIIATFASNVHRIQQIIDCAAKFGRKVSVSGRSMINTVAIGQELGYLNIPEGTLVDISMINRYPKEQMVLITTGSQGEPMSALTRMAFSDHRQVEIGSDDFIIISANPIPGNEKTVSNVVNELLKHGCEVVYEKMYEVHVSGHACQEELKIILGLTKPQYFIPVHGEQKHLQKHAALASLMGIPDKNIVIADLGNSVEVSQKEIKIVGKVPSGRVLVDGLGVGDVGSVVLRDRKHLAQDGLIIAVAAIDAYSGRVISGPNVVSRGFVYVRDSEPLMDEACELVASIIDECADRGIRDWAAIKNRIRDELSRIMFQKTKRSPMILPILMEV